MGFTECLLGPGAPLHPAQAPPCSTPTRTFHEHPGSQREELGLREGERLSRVTGNRGSWGFVPFFSSFKHSHFYF